MFGSSDKTNAFLYRECFLLLPVPVLLVNSSGEFVNVTYAFLEAVQSTTDKLKSAPVSAHWSPLDGKSQLPQLIDNWSGEVCWISETGQRNVVRIVVRALGEGEARGFLIFADSTTVFQSTVASGNTRQHRLESLGLYASSVAHDLSNVLTGVLGHVSFLKLALPKDKSYSESLSAIEDGSKRAATMTQHILEYSRGEESDSREVQLAALIRAVVSLTREMLPQGVVLEFAEIDENLLVIGDESQIRRAIMNLLINARDAIGKEGKISVELKERMILLDDSERLGVVPGKYASLKVSDDGSGIPAEVEDKIFEPFFTTKSSAGTGLGLANVLSIMQSHSGTVAYHTVLGEGTQFELLFPVHSEVSSKSVDAQSEIAQGSEKILVVDDEESVRLILQKSLEHLGYQVEVAEDGNRAAEIFRQGHRFDLVVMDMIMPEMPGDELFFVLKAIDPEVKVLISSGYSSDRRTKAVLDNGGVGLIRKPFTVEELAEVVRRCLDARS